MLTLAQFHTMAEEEANQEPITATRVVSATRQAARWFERNYTFQYMRRFVTFSVDAEAAYPRTLPLPGKPDTDGGAMGCKSIEFLRFILPDGSFHYLERTDPYHVTKVETVRPVGYWVDGVDYIWFDSTPPEDYSGEMYYTQFSSWPTTTTETHWLLNNAEDAMLFQTVIFLAAFLQEQGMLQYYTGLRNEALRTLVNSDIELQSNNKDYRMRFQGG